MILLGKEGTLLSNDSAVASIGSEATFICAKRFFLLRFSKDGDGF